MIQLPHATANNYRCGSMVGTIENNLLLRIMFPLKYVKTVRVGWFMFF